ncbi:hypothetical protein WY13_01769 [Clostridium ljungdahlii]|uniref:Uncharacterized protein n=1 Tax=Clostridium ljungdahlii TaxID=1538 RepID=A0A168Q2W7_9CLOT|nr:hypothetical protein WY13_01769 [Clostridium ljungdahlii]
MIISYINKNKHWLKLVLILILFTGYSKNKNEIII